MDDSHLTNKSAAVLNAFSDANLMLTCAESCTGGMVSAALTRHAGSSDVLERSFVTYSNEAKIDLLGVPREILKTYGAVSEETARAMVEGALQSSPAQVSLAVTGIVGPGGASPGKPIGTVHIASAKRGGAFLHERLALSGTREQIRIDSAIAVLNLALQAVGIETA